MKHSHAWGLVFLYCMASWATVVVLALLLL
jgi:hypothetical protein